MAKRKSNSISIRSVLLALVAFGLVWAGWDFLQFAKRTSNLAPPPSVPMTGAVALTGGSGIRIAAGIELVESQNVTRLLISGVHPDATIPDLQQISGGKDETYACCIDLDFNARSTVQNAEEIAPWVEAHGFSTIIVVTSDFHMPRALLLLERELPETELIPYPVTSAIDPNEIWTEKWSFRGTIVEWAKWRVTQLS